MLPISVHADPAGSDRSRRCKSRSPPRPAVVSPRTWWVAASAICCSAASPKTSTSPPRPRRPRSSRSSATAASSAAASAWRTSSSGRRSSRPRPSAPTRARSKPTTTPRRSTPSSGHGDNELYIRRDNVFGTAEEDARRRDFTINGLFYDLDRRQGHRLRRGAARSRAAHGAHDRRSRRPLPRRSDPHPARAQVRGAARTSRSSRRPTRPSSRTRARSPSARRRACSRRSTACCAVARRGARSSCLQATGVLTVLIPELHRLLAREGDHVGAERLIQTLDAHRRAGAGRLRRRRTRSWCAR